jgi:hypothetical protein
VREIVVVAAEHAQLFEPFVAGDQPVHAWRVDPSGVGDHEGVTPVSLRLPWIEL